MPPRPRSPRPRPNPARRPRVAGMAPTASRADGAARPSGDPADTTTAAAPAPASGRPVEPVPEAPDGDRTPRGRGPAGPDGVQTDGDQTDGVRTDGGQPGDRLERPRPKAAPAARTTEPAAADESARDRSGAREAEQTEAVPVVERTKQAAPAGKTRRKPAAASPTARDERKPPADPADDEAGSSTGNPPTSAADSRVPGVLRGRAVPLLAAALVVLAAVAVVAGIQDARLRGTPAAANVALVDVGATAEVAGQLSDALETVYSFDFTRLDENENAAREVITPAFAGEFERLFGEVRARAPEQQAVVSATVTLSAVKEITGDRAVMVAFVDQQATRAAPDAESQELAAAGRLTVTGERVDGRWKIAEVTPL